MLGVFAETLNEGESNNITEQDVVHSLIVNAVLEPFQKETKEYIMPARAGKGSERGTEEKNKALKG